MEAKTIQIFLPHGEPRGMRVAEITTGVIQAVAIPRTKLEQAFKRSETGQVAVYFLFGGDDEKAKPSVYIGQTEDLRTRLADHNAKKDFWQTAVFLISLKNSFTQIHIRYLEWLFIEMTRKTGRYELENTSQSSKPHVTEPMEADLQNAFETSTVLLGTLGFPVFEPLAQKGEQGEDDVFLCTGPDADATGQLVEDGFVVFKGSRGRIKAVPSAYPWIETLRKPMIEQGILKEEGNRYVFMEDFLFKSPSAAGLVVLARNSNGWVDWKKKDGKTLHDVKRAGVPEKGSESK